ncbi:hypothetical protein CB1_001219011 [Camelus ferus]|nr:hypothetical protein CB1_001219011 [Camelus ferus]
MCITDLARPQFPQRVITLATKTVDKDIADQRLVSATLWAVTWASVSSAPVPSSACIDILALKVCFCFPTIKSWYGSALCDATEQVPKPVSLSEKGSGATKLIRVGVKPGEDLGPAREHSGVPTAVVPTLGRL